MDQEWSDPRVGMVAGTLILLIGYVTLGDPVRFSIPPTISRMVFYGGLLLLVISVARWLRLPPAPDPTERADEEPDRLDD
jgi:hypothetical protein